MHVSIAYLKTNQKSLKLLECFFKAFPHILSVDLWNCSVDHTTFEQIGRLSGLLIDIALRDSGIGKNMGDYLQILNPKNIRRLLIMSEPIGNKSVKS